MHRNGTHAAPPPTLAAALIAAESTGTIDPSAWPAIRELLLSTTDPHLVAAAGPLRQLVQARQAVAKARHALSDGYSAVTGAGDDLARLSEAAANLAALADDLSARAQQLAGLHA